MVLSFILPSNDFANERMNDGVNSVERLIANMDFAQVNAAVVVQEYIDGNQDEYLLKCKEKYPERNRNYG